MLSMRPITIDFRDQPNAAGWRSRLFMLVALGMFSLSLAHYTDVSARLKAANEYADKISSKLGISHNTTKSTGVAVGDNHSQVEDSVNVEWDKMLAAVENATTENVAVTAIQANPKKKQVTVTGQARSYTHALEFVQKLADKKAFSNAYLANHTLDENDPDKPVDFIVEATWITH